MNRYKRTTAACYTGLLTQAAVNNFPPLLFVIFSETFGISIDRISILIMLNFATQALSDFTASWGVEYVGYKKSIILAHVLSFIAFCGMGLLPYVGESAFLVLAVIMCINAVGGGLIEVMVSPIIENLPSENSEKAMSMLHAVYCIGAVVTVAVTTVLLAVFGSGFWRYIPFIWAIVPLCGVVLFSGIEVCPVSHEEAVIPFGKLLLSPVFLLFLVLMVCAGAAEQAMAQWASYFAEAGLNITKAVGDVAGVCMFSMFMGISRFLYGKFGEKIELKTFIAISSGLCIVCYMTAAFSANPVLTLIACAFCGLTVGIMWPGVFSTAARHLPNGGMAMWAFFALAGDFGCTVGPAVVAYGAQLFGKFSLGFALAAIFPILLLAGMFLLKKME